MTMTIISAGETGRIPVIPRLRPWSALVAAMKLVANKEDTSQAFEIMHCLTGSSNKRAYDKMLSTAEGGRIAFEREEIMAILAEATAQPEPGTVADAYARFMSKDRLSAREFSQNGSAKHKDGIGLPHPYAWYGRRLRDLHDVWHILTGYDRDALGEACLVAFSFGQTKHPGFLLIALMAGLKMAHELADQPVRAALFEAYHIGQRAAWLPGQDYQTLMTEALHAARERLGLSPPATYFKIPVERRRAALRPRRKSLTNSVPLSTETPTNLGASQG